MAPWSWGGAVSWKVALKSRYSTPFLRLAVGEGLPPHLPRRLGGTGQNRILQ